MSSDPGLCDSILMLEPIQSQVAHWLPPLTNRRNDSQVVSLSWLDPIIPVIFTNNILHLGDQEVDVLNRINAAQSWSLSFKQLGSRVGQVFSR